jgi:hypothetical protein
MASTSSQDVLEKFEFFPVKCRIQRASEVFAKVTERKQKEQNGRPLKAKVNQALNYKMYCHEMILHI